MAGVKKLRKIQIGQESTAGDEVNASTVWRGTGTIEDQLVTVFPDEDVGYLSGIDRQYIPKVQAALAFDETPATFEQIIHIFNAGVQADTAGAADGTGSGHIYDHVTATTAATTTLTYTMEGGDNQQEEQFKYGFVESFTISGVAGESLMMSANWLGRQIAVGSFTAGQTAPTVEEILFSKGTLAIDPDTNAAGTTTKSNTLLEMALSHKTGLVPVFTGDGAIYFTFTKNIGPEILLDLTFEHDTTGVAEKAAWRAGTTRIIQLSFAGSTLASSGSSYSTKTFRIRVAGKWEKFDKIGEKDGNDVVKGTLRACYNATRTLFAEYRVVNEVGTLQ